MSRYIFVGLFILAIIGWRTHRSISVSTNDRSEHETLVSEPQEQPEQRVVLKQESPRQPTAHEPTLASDGNVYYQAESASPALMRGAHGTAEEMADRSIEAGLIAREQRDDFIAQIRLLQERDDQEPESQYP